jgi:hypothetical protein
LVATLKRNPKSEARNKTEYRNRDCKGRVPDHSGIWFFILVWDFEIRISLFVPTPLLLSVTWVAHSSFVLRHSDATRQLEIQELVKQIRGHPAVEGYSFRI